MSHASCPVRRDSGELLCSCMEFVHFAHSEVSLVLGLRLSEGGVNEARLPLEVADRINMDLSKFILYTYVISIMKEKNY